MDGALDAGHVRAQEHHQGVAYPEDMGEVRVVQQGRVRQAHLAHQGHRAHQEVHRAHPGHKGPWAQQGSKETSGPRYDEVTNATEFIHHKPPMVVESDSTEVVDREETRQRPVMFLHPFAQLSDHLHRSELPVVSSSKIARDQSQLSANLMKEIGMVRSLSGHG